MPSFNEEPNWLRAEGWQRSDDAHPAGKGDPAYRVVYKTLRLVLPELALEWANLRVEFGFGQAHRGGMKLPGTLPARAPNHWVLPEAGELLPGDPGELRYEPVPNVHFEFRAWEEELAKGFFAEFLLKTSATEAGEQLAEGRPKLASLKVMLDLRFGRRLLGVPVTEEVGTVFADWHFNRSLNSELLGAESQVPVQAIQPLEFESWARSEMDAYMQRQPSMRERFGLACDWYWAAIHSEEPVMQFLNLWFSVEVVAMEDTTNVRPVRERLAEIIGGDEKDWAPFVGRLYGKRSRLAHGNELRQVSPDELGDLRQLVEVLLRAETGAVAPDRADALKKRAEMEAEP